MATHEEKERLLEEERFGSGSEPVVLVETFEPERMLMTVKEAIDNGKRFGVFFPFFFFNPHLLFQKMEECNL